MNFGKVLLTIITITISVTACTKEDLLDFRWGFEYRGTYKFPLPYIHQDVDDVWHENDTEVGFFLP